MKHLKELAQHGVAVSRDLVTKGNIPHDVLNRKGAGLGQPLS